MRTLLVPALAAGAMLLGSTLPSLADPNLPNIGAHRHFIRTPDGTLVEVGPRFCDDPSLQKAFNQFHANLHKPVAGALGPQTPGLHNDRGAELVAQRTC